MAQVFVAHPFNHRAQSILNSAVRPALESHGLICVTVHGDLGASVVDVVRNAIEQSDALIGLVFGSNPNVFFEIGMASARRKPCILLADSAEDVAMLGSSYPVITMHSHASVMSELTSQIGSWCRLANAREVGANRDLHSR